MIASKIHERPQHESSMKPIDPWPHRVEIIRAIGTGFGSLAGVDLVFLSFPVSVARSGLLTSIALVSFALALPLLAFCAVSAFTLSWVVPSQRKQPHVRRALGATIIFGICGAMSTVIGITTILWSFTWQASLAFAVGTVLVCIVYFDFVQNVARAPRLRNRPSQSA